MKGPRSSFHSIKVGKSHVEKRKYFMRKFDVVTKNKEKQESCERTRKKKFV